MGNANWNAAKSAGASATTNRGQAGSAVDVITSTGKNAGGGKSSGSSNTKPRYDPELDPLLPEYAQAAPAGSANDGDGIPLWLIIGGAAVGGVILANQLSKKRR